MMSPELSPELADCEEEWTDLAGDELLQQAREQPSQEGLLSLETAQRLAMELGQSLPDMLSSVPDLATLTAMLPASLTTERTSGACAGAALLGAEDSTGQY